MTPIIQKIECLTANPKQFEVLVFRFHLDIECFKKQCNPFDYDQITLFSLAEDPSGKQVRVEAYWTKTFSITLEQQDGEPVETLQDLGFEGYQLRFFPTEAGVYHFRFMMEFEDDTSEISQLVVTVEKGEGKNHLIRVEPTNHRTFIQSDGSDFIPIGQNLCWPLREKNGTFSFDPWLKKIAYNGGNWIRIWLRMNQFSLVKNSTTCFYDRLGEMSKLDRLLSLSQSQNIHFMLCLLQHGMFSEVTNPNWVNNPWNSANGGYLERPEYFFTDTRAKHDFKMMLHYYVARFAIYDHLFAWELFNEVDWTDRYDEEIVAAWHDEMAKTIKQCDPYRHMVTTSFKSYLGKANELDSIDFANPHSYDYFEGNTLPMIQEKQQLVWNRYHKPVLHSEIGFDWRSGWNTLSADPDGIAFFQALLGGIFAGGAGTAMSWWWDSYIDSAHLYTYYFGISRIAKRLRFTGRPFTVFDASQMKCSDPDVSACGYLFDKELVLLVYDRSWSYQEPKRESHLNVKIQVPFPEGTYRQYLYECKDGRTSGVFFTKVQNGVLELNLPILDRCSVILVR